VSGVERMFLSYFNKKNLNKLLFGITFLLVLHFLTFRVIIPDYDLWARLAVGSIFFQTGGVLKHDIFSYAPTKPLWVDHEWGSGVILYTLAHFFGDTGILIFKAILIFIVLFLIIKTYRLYTGNRVRNEALYFILIGYSLYPCIASSVRSQIFTYLFFMLWIYVLERVRRGETKLLWVLPATMLFWVNMHGGFLSGLGLLLIYTIGEFFNGQNAKKYLFTLAGILLVTLITPYGINFWHYIIEAVTLKRISFIEWQPMDLRQGPVHVFFGIKFHVLLGFVFLVIMSFIVGIKALIQKTSPDWSKIILLAVTFYLSLKHQRHCIFFILAASSLLYHQYANLVGIIREFIRKNLGNLTVNSLFLSKVLIVSALIYQYSVCIIPSTSFQMLTYPNFYPVGSIEFIKQNNLKGNLGITYNWGSYALWKLYPQCKVFIDGRYEEVYSNDLYITALKFSEHISYDWYRFLNYYHTDIVVAPKSAYDRNTLTNELPSWQIVYEDAVSFLLLPKNKLKSSYTYPNFNNSIYWHEDFGKSIRLKG
jgi:hypothetical protein